MTIASSYMMDAALLREFSIAIDVPRLQMEIHHCADTWPEIELRGRNSYISLSVQHHVLTLKS